VQRDQPIGTSEEENDGIKETGFPHAARREKPAGGAVAPAAAFSSRAGFRWGRCAAVFHVVVQGIPDKLACL